MFEQLWKSAAGKAASVIGTVTEPVRRIAAIPEQMRERKAAEERAAQLEREAAGERERLEREAAAERTRQALRAAERRAFRERQVRRKTTRRVAFYGFLGLIGLGACSVLGVAVIGMLTDQTVPSVPAEPLAATELPLAATPTTPKAYNPPVIETTPAVEPQAVAPEASTIAEPATVPKIAAAQPPVTPPVPLSPQDKRSTASPAQTVEIPVYMERSGDKAKRRPSGGTVHVKGYFRKDGTWVEAHDRAAPGDGTDQPLSTEAASSAPSSPTVSSSEQFIRHAFGPGIHEKRWDCCSCP